jgi:hypothetical protein
MYETIILVLMLSVYEISFVSRGNISTWSKTKCGEEYVIHEKFNRKVERLIE